MTLYDLLAVVFGTLVLYVLAPKIYAWWKWRQSQREEQAEAARREYKEAQKKYEDGITKEREAYGITTGVKVRVKASGHEGCVKHSWHYPYHISIEALKLKDRHLWKGHACCTIMIFDLNDKKNGRGTFREYEFLMHELEKIDPKEGST